MCWRLQDTFSTVFGTRKPELTYCSLPAIVKFESGGAVFTLLVESITVGLKALPLLTITVFIPFLPGIIFGSLLDPGGKGMNLVEFETANGVSAAVIVLSLKTNVTVWGSATGEGLYHVTLSPALILILCGESVPR